MPTEKKYLPVTVRANPEMNYLVCVDGVPDDEDTPFRGHLGLRDALLLASSIKTDDPDRIVTLVLVSPK